MQEVKESPSIKLYHWTAKSRKYRIKQVGLKVKVCLYSPTGRGVYASAIPSKWQSAMRYDNDSDVICFSFFSDGLRMIRHGDDDYIVLENVPASRLTYEGDIYG